MRLDNETGEYWDGFADSQIRKDFCLEIVSHTKPIVFIISLTLYTHVLCCCFLMCQLKVFDIVIGHRVNKTKKFECFPVFKPPQCPVQNNLFDCGLHVAKHMEEYEVEWWIEVCFSLVQENLNVQYGRH